MTPQLPLKDFPTCLVDSLIHHFHGHTDTLPAGSASQDDTRRPHGPRAGATTAQTPQGYNLEKLLFISPLCSLCDILHYEMGGGVTFLVVAWKSSVTQPGGLGN